MRPVIKNYKDYENPILGKKDGVPNYVMLYVRHEPGESSPLHTHPWEHQAFITEGSGVLYCDGKEYPIKEGDAVHVPENLEHQFRNICLLYTSDRCRRRLRCRSRWSPYH